MNDDRKTFTEAQVRERERKAWEACAAWIRDVEDNNVGETMSDRVRPNRAHLEANVRYPAPTKPRVVVVNDKQYRAVDGVIQVEINGKWLASGMFRAKSLERDLADLHTLRDLLAHPDEPCNE